MNPSIIPLTDASWDLVSQLVFLSGFPWLLLVSFAASSTSSWGLGPNRDAGERVQRPNAVPECVKLCNVVTVGPSAAQQACKAPGDSLRPHPPLCVKLSYIIFRAPGKMKMWAPCSKVIQECQELATAEHQIKCGVLLSTGRCAQVTRPCNRPCLYA